MTINYQKVSDRIQEYVEEFAEVLSGRFTDGLNPEEQDLFFTAISGLRIRPSRWISYVNAPYILTQLHERYFTRNPCAEIVIREGESDLLPERYIRDFGGFNQQRNK